jgi:Asp-tRNA(Asn)/Glu-tRNA(Gln) amidotransferase A subunit family amidase
MMVFDMVSGEWNLRACCWHYRSDVTTGHRTQEDCATIKDMITKSRTEGFGSEVQRRIIVGTFALSRK